MASCGAHVRARPGIRRGRGALAFALLAAVTGLAVAACSDSVKPPPPGAGVTWVSGANGNFPPEVNAWGTWRGAPARLAIVFTDRSNWANIVDASWPLGAFTPATFAGGLSVAVPLFPQSGSLAACAAGAYDHYWASFGRNLVRYGRADAYVRLGWEFNGNWFWWSATNPARWKACFQRSVTAIRSTDPRARIDWNLSAHRNSLPDHKTSVWAVYPGDSYVDVIGVDAYDSYPPSRTGSTWKRQCEEPSGLCTAAAFARAHHKKLSVPEWGLVRSAGGGGDNPFYIAKMYEAFRQDADILAYEAYFNNADEGNVKSSLDNPDLNPSASAEYRRLFGAGGDGD